MIFCYRRASLFVQDLTFLRTLYNKINRGRSVKVPVRYPKCDHSFETELADPGQTKAPQ